MNITRRNLPFALPALLFESLVDGLGNRGLHQVNVAHYEWCKSISQMLVEATIL